MKRKIRFYHGLPEEEIIPHPLYEKELEDEGPDYGAFSSERDLQEYLDEDLFKN